MNNMSSQDSNIWNKLGAAPKGEIITARPAFPEISEHFLAGIDANGYRHFLIPLVGKEQGLDDNKSRGISIACKDLVVGKNEQGLKPSKYIDIMCQDAAGYDAFDVIGHEIVVSLSTPGITKAEVVSNTLAKWRYFWGKPPTNILSHDKIIGLFSELWYLNKWLLPHMDHTAALTGWRGPYGSRHDFEWQGKSVEVKGTTSTRGSIHWINGIEQLVPPEKGKLFFFSLRLREEGGATNTLPSVIALCRKAISRNTHALSIFENALVLAEYSPMHDDEYNKITLRIVDELLYEVKGTFPRIIPDNFKSDIPSGIETVRYEINLDGNDNLIRSKIPIDFTTYSKSD